jgi:hypothetical protein
MIESSEVLFSDNAERNRITYLRHSLNAVVRAVSCYQEWKSITCHFQPPFGCYLTSHNGALRAI